MFQESYTILSSVEDRRLYDWSLARNENPDRYAWPFEVDITQTINSPDTPPPAQVNLWLHLSTLWDNVGAIFFQLTVSNNI